MDSKHCALMECSRPALRQADLLWPYAIVPLLLVVVAMDGIAMSHSLRDALPSSPNQVAWYGFFFGFPHIVGSFISMADGQYICHYKKELMKIMPVALGLSGLMSFYLSLPVALLFFNVITAYHTMGQQAGVARAFLNSSGKLYERWRGSVNALACILPIELLVAFGALDGAMAACVHVSVLALSLVSALLAGWLWHRQNQKVSSLHLLLTQALLLMCVYFVVEGYYFFVFLAPQFVHDITAFTIYAAHDRSRVSSAPGRNRFYALVSVRKAHVIWLLLASVGVAYVVTDERMRFLALFLSFVHYFFEAPAWRRGSLHRQQLAFAR